MNEEKVKVESSDERLEEVVIKKQFKASSVNDNLPRCNDLNDLIKLTGGYVFRGEVSGHSEQSDAVIFNRNGVKTIVPLTIWFAFATRSTLSYRIDEIELKRTVRELVTISEMHPERLDGPTERNQLVRFVNRQNKLVRKWFRSVRKTLKLNVAAIELNQPLPSYFKVYYVYDVENARTS